jgi:hypothetical protein
MLPLAGLDTVLEPSRLPRLSPWAKGCRPPRRASNDAEVLELTLMGLTLAQAPARGGTTFKLGHYRSLGNPGIYLHDPPPRALRSLLRQADDALTCL